MKWMVRLALVICFSCTGTDVGNNPKPSLDFTLNNLSAAALSALPNGLSITEAWTAVDRIRLRDAAGCEDENELQIDGPFALNLLVVNDIPALRNIAYMSRVFCRFDFRWEPFDEDELDPQAPTELAGAGLYIAGTRADATPVIVRTVSSQEFRLDARDEGFFVDALLGGLIVAVDATVLFTGLDLDSAVVSDGVVRIEPGSNESLLQAFEANVLMAVRLFGDQNGDGSLDEDEDEDDDTLAD